MVNFLLMVNIILYVIRDSLDGKSIPAPSKKVFLPYSVWSSRDYNWKIWKKRLLIWKKRFERSDLKEEITHLFWKLPWYFLFPQEE